MHARDTPLTRVYPAELQPGRNTCQRKGFLVSSPCVVLSLARGFAASGW